MAVQTRARAFWPGRRGRLLPMFEAGFTDTAVAELTLAAASAKLEVGEFAISECGFKLSN